MYIKQNIRNDNDGDDESWLKQLQLEAEEELVPPDWAAVCSTTPILRHCVSQPNLTEPLDIDRNE